MGVATKKFFNKPLCSLVLGVLLTLAVVGAVRASVFVYTSKEFPPLITLQNKYIRLTDGRSKIDSIVGKVSDGNDSWIVYYYRVNSDGKMQIDDDIVVTKLDTDVWIMKAGDFMGSGVSWGIISGE